MQLNITEPSLPTQSVRFTWLLLAIAINAWRQQYILSIDKISVADVCALATFIYHKGNTSVHEFRTVSML
jgi:hypothetical protein